MQNMSAVIDDSNPSKEIDVTTPAALSSLDKIYIHNVNVLNKKIFCCHWITYGLFTPGRGRSSYLCKDCFLFLLLSRLSPSVFHEKKKFFQTETKFSSVSITAG